MRKEVLLAIILGVGLGLVLTFGIWKANRALKENQTTAGIFPTPAVSGESVEASGLTLSILQPEEGDLAGKDKIAVTGSTSPGANLIILSDTGEQAGVADSRGSFETTVELIGGANDIKVIAFNPNTGERVEKQVTVVFSTQFEE